MFQPLVSNSKVIKQKFNHRGNHSKWNFFFFSFKLVTRSGNFLFINFELITRKWKNKHLTFELVTQSEI